MASVIALPQRKPMAESPASRSATPARRRLRTRIIVSFALLGFGLTALFAGVGALREGMAVRPLESR